MVGISSTETNNTTSVKRKTHKKHVASIVLFIIILCGAGVWYFIGVEQSPKKQQSTLVDVCEGDAAIQVQKAIMGGDSTALQSYAGKVRQADGYRTSASCLYIVTEADITLGNTNDAKMHFAALEGLLKDGQVLDSAFERPQVQVAAAREAIEFMASNDVVQTENEDGISPEDMGLSEEGGDR